MHPLDEWIINQVLTRKEFADKLDISVATLSRYLSRDRVPKPEIMRKIIEATGGIITPETFYSIGNYKDVQFKKSFFGTDLLSIEVLNANEITSILDRSEYFIKPYGTLLNSQKNYKNRTLINLFFEDSTRTITSFELAAKRLGMNVINMQIETSSIRKGESLIDTAMTLNAMHPDILVIRHFLSGVPHLLADKVRCAVINAGDGQHEHPTQALLDALVIRRRKGKIKGLKVAICGDIAHSRVARSNIKLLTTMGAKVNVIAPKTLIPNGIENLGARIYNDMKKGLENTDIVMILRLQHERMHGSYIPSPREYFRFYGLDIIKLGYAKRDALVMHPGPINRGIEIDSQLADDIDRTLILEQVELGVAIRMSVIEHLISNTEN